MIKNIWNSACTEYLTAGLPQQNLITEIIMKRTESKTWFAQEMRWRWRRSWSRKSVYVCETYLSIECETNSVVMLSWWPGGRAGRVAGVWWWHPVSTVVSWSSWLLVQRGNTQLQHHFTHSAAPSTPAWTTAGGRGFWTWRPCAGDSVADQRVFGWVEAVCRQGGTGPRRCSHRWQHCTERRPSQRRRHVEEPRPAVDRKRTRWIRLGCRHPGPSQPQGPSQKSRRCAVWRNGGWADRSKPFTWTGDVHPARGVWHCARRVRYQLCCIHCSPTSKIPLQGLRIVDGGRGLDLDRSWRAEAERGECGVYEDTDAGCWVRWSGVSGDDGCWTRGRCVSTAAASAAEAWPSTVSHSELDCVKVTRSTMQHRPGTDGIDGDAAGSEVSSAPRATVLSSRQHGFMARTVFQIRHHVRHGLGMQRTRRSPFQSRTDCIFWRTAWVCCLTPS